MRYLLPLLGLMGCLAPRNPLPEGSEPMATVQPALPDIAWSRIVCRPREGLWQLDLATTGWVGQARTWWTVTGDYVESHEMLSHGYDPDGTAEWLYLELPIAPDVNLAEDGTLTAFSCGDAPSIRWAITPPEGPVHACVHTEGAFDDWASVRGVASCPDDPE